MKVRLDGMHGHSITDGLDGSYPIVPKIVKGGSRIYEGTDPEEII
jgi:hypothetical protein